MAYDFPSSPSVGDQFPPTTKFWTWDGSAWVPTAGLGGTTGPIPEAPTDGRVYGRQGSTATWQAVTAGGGIPEAPNDGAIYGRGGNPTPIWTKSVPLAGGTMTGTLTLSGGPIGVNDAANKGYVDSNAVSYTTPQGLASANQIIGRQNIYAAPFEAMTDLNLIINGSMQVSQELVTNSLTLINTTQRYVTDGWIAIYNHGANTAVFSTAQSSVGGVSPIGVQNGLILTASTALTAPANGDFAVILQKIEGLRWARTCLGPTGMAQPLALSFWVNSNVATGNFTVSLRNTSNNRCYTKILNYSSAGVWQYFSIVIPAETTGTWNYDNTSAVTVGFAFACGSNFFGTDATWNTTNAFGVSGQSNFFATNGNSVQISGVSLFVGSEGPSAARTPHIVRPYNQDLQLCMRYYEKSFPNNVAVAQNAGFTGCFAFAQDITAGNIQIVGTVCLSVSKRTTGYTFTLYNPAAANAQIRNASKSSDWTASASDRVGNNMVSIIGTTAGGSAIGDSSYVQWTADARL